MMELSKDQAAAIAPFPPGVKVYIYDDTENPPSVNAKGTVNSAFVTIEAGTPDFRYKIDLSTGRKELQSEGKDKDNKNDELFRGKYLRFQNGTPVKVRMDGGGNDNMNIDNTNKKKEEMDGIILGSCDVPNDDRRRYTSDTFWYSIQVLGSEESNDGMSEIIHEVRPSDVTCRAIPSVVEFQTAPPNPNTTIDVANNESNGEGAYEGETQTQSSAAGSKRYREEDGHLPLPPPPQMMQPLPPHPPSYIGNTDNNNNGYGGYDDHDGYNGHEPPPLAKRHCGLIKREENESNMPLSSHHHLPQSVDQVPRKKAKLRNFDIRYKGSHEYHAIIDVPLAKVKIMGPLIGQRGQIHKELMRKSACFISVGGDNEDSAVGIFSETTNQVERGVREVKDALFNYFKEQGSEQIINTLEVEYFERNQLVCKYTPNMSTHHSDGMGVDFDEKVKMEMNIPAKRKLTSEYSMDVDIGNLRLMLPGVDFYHLRKTILGHDRTTLGHLKEMTDCKRIMATKNGKGGPDYVELFSYHARTTEEGLYTVFDFIESELGPMPNAFILRRG